RRVDRDVADRCAEVRVYRHGQPARAARRLDAVPVLPAVLLVLDRVEEDEAVGGGPLGEVPEPRQVVRLVDRDLHGRLRKIGLDSRRPGPRASSAARSVRSDTRKTVCTGPILLPSVTPWNPDSPIAHAGRLRSPAAYWRRSWSQPPPPRSKRVVSSYTAPNAV